MVFYSFYIFQDTFISPKTLIITTPEKVSSMTTQKIFAYPTRPIVVSLKQEIYQYPTQDTAYVVLAKTESGWKFDRFLLEEEINAILARGKTPTTTIEEGKK